MSGVTQLLLSEKELIGLYMLLKDREEGLDFTMAKLFSRIESAIYQKLTIEELENIHGVYLNHLDIEERKG
jgi:hypothetical protein